MDPMSPERWKRIGRIALIAAGLIVVFGTHLAFTSYFVDHGKLGADEGFYAIAARNVMEGKLPYRDFAYTQMPLLPYWNGIAMSISRFGLTEQRVINVIWSFIGLLGVILALRQRFGSWEPGIVAAFAVAASPHFAELQAVGTSHGAGGMFMALSAGIVLTTFPLRWRAIAFGFLGTMAVGTRLSLGPTVLLLELILIIEARGWRQRLIAIAVPAAFVAAGLLPFLLAAPEKMAFNVWHYHLASVFDRRRMFNLIQWWHIAPAAIVVLLAGLAGLPSLLKRRQWSVAALLVGALLGVTLPMIPKSSYGLYIAPVVLVAAVAGLTAIWSIGKARRSPFRHAIWLLPLLVLYHPLPDTVKSARRNVVTIAEFVRDEVPPGPILTPTPIVAIEAGRSVIHRTEMGMFCAMSPRDRMRARYLNLTTIIDLTDHVNRKRPIAVVKMKGGSRWNFKWAVPTLVRQPRGVYAKFEKALHKNYQSVKKAGMFEVLVRR
jgi:hypothetical protein